MILFDRLFEGVQTLYCSPDKKGKLLSVLMASKCSVSRIQNAEKLYLR